VRACTLAMKGLIGLPVAAALLSVAGPAEASGSWVWPLAGPHTVSRGFDPPATPYGPGHRGADLPGRPGQPVRAAGAGRVSYAGLLAGRGVVVVVHGDLRTTYEPVAAMVRVGQQVAAGAVIGQLTAGGHPGCPQVCLHWGLLRGTAYLDPVQLLARGPSRLLPIEAPPRAAVAPAGSVPAALVPAAVVPRRVRASPAAVPRPADEPAFSLRAGDAASAGGAVAALVVGLVLLRRSPRPPHHPVAPAVAAAGPAPDPAPTRHESQAVGLVDLAAERHRRRPEVA